MHYCLHCPFACILYTTQYMYCLLHSLHVLLTLHVTLAMHIFEIFTQSISIQNLVTMMPLAQFVLVEMRISAFVDKAD